MAECVEPTKVPGVQKQLTGAKSGPYDCVVRGGVDWPITWSTGKQITPTDPMDLRHRMGISSATVGATIDQAKTGYQSFQADAAELGLDVPNMNVRDEGASSTTRAAGGIWPALDAGSAVVLFVWYGKVNALVPWASGDPDFSGGHCWTLYGTRDPEDGPRKVCVYDPLHDGAHGRPAGPLWLKLSDVLDCAAAFRQGGVPGNDPLGEGHAIFGIVKRARCIVPPVPTPPEPDCEDQLGQATAALAEIRALGVEIVWPRLVDMADAGLVDSDGTDEAAEDGAI